jgi:hypothetical protein
MSIWSIIAVFCIITTLTAMSFLVLCKIEKVEGIWGRIYRTPLAFVIVVLLMLIMLGICNYADNRVENKKLRILNDSTDFSVSDGFVYFTYEGNKYKVDVENFSSIEYTNEATTTYKEHKLRIGEK